MLGCGVISNLIATPTPIGAKSFQFIFVENDVPVEGKTIWLKHYDENKSRWVEQSQETNKDGIVIFVIPQASLGDSCNFRFGLSVSMLDQMRSVRIPSDVQSVVVRYDGIRDELTIIEGKLVTTGIIPLP